MGEDELAALRCQLKELELEHRDLDATITGLARDAYVDQLNLQRLKKRKLQLKDTIARLKDQLIPDLKA